MNDVIKRPLPAFDVLMAERMTTIPTAVESHIVAVVVTGWTYFSSSYQLCGFGEKLPKTLVYSQQVIWQLVLKSDGPRIR